VDVAHQVLGDVVWVIQKLLKIEPAGVVKRLPGGSYQKLLPKLFGRLVGRMVNICLTDGFAGGLQHLV